MEHNSFYHSTNRVRIGEADVLATKKNYSFNYLSLLPANRDAHIVELGCSEGFCLEWLIENGYSNIVGVDSDGVAVDIAQKKLKDRIDENRIVCKDALSFLRSCGENTCDSVLMFNIIEHIPKDVIVEIVTEIRRVLKPSGSFIVQTGNWENPFNIGLFTRDFTHQVMYTANSLKQLMVLGGFTNDKIDVAPIRYQTTFRNFPVQVLSPIFGWMMRTVALFMRAHIHETAPLIYCIVRK